MDLIAVREIIALSRLERDGAKGYMAPLRIEEFHKIFNSTRRADNEY